MQIRSIGELQLPGTCYVCGNGTCDEGYVDFGTFVDYHGSFYLCLICAKQLAELLGYFSPDEVQTTQALLSTYVTENESLKKELENARPVLDSLTSFLQSTVQSSGFIGSDVAEAADESRPFGDDSTEGSEATDSDATESVDSAGRSNTGRTTKRHFTVVD
jgi:hypothetical protein